ncbi:MAG: GNAT family N-acetyltransferase [Candidatus Thiodiazotropha lotti]|nr:GNAT family N-acetyltransferase [Candidatus Thiodiazotropha lotti]
MVNFLKFNDSFREVVALDATRRIALRLITPNDKALLQQGFDSLSGESRLRRFMAEKRFLSQQELAYFTEVDQMDHFALGMVLLDESGNETEGVAIGRFIRLAGDAETAEVGLTVADSMQGQGLGQLLLKRLISAALERGINRFRFECLAHNQEMKQLLLKVCREAVFRYDGGVMIAEATLPAPLGVPPVYNPLDLMDGLVRQMQSLFSGAFKYQSGVGMDLMKQGLDVPFRLRH